MSDRKVRNNFTHYHREAVGGECLSGKFPIEMHGNPLSGKLRYGFSVRVLIVQRSEIDDAFRPLPRQPAWAGLW